MINYNGKKYHTSLNIRNALDWSRTGKQKFAKYVFIDGKHLNTADEVNTWLLDMLSEGYEMLPIEECDNFDKKTGCLGHEI